MNLAAEFGNDAWQAELRKIASLEDCQFPANDEIKISGTRAQVAIKMTKKGLLTNMQTDAAAFEAWALTLLLHCGVQSIQIGLDADAADAEGRHYQRFLYRLKRFCDLFPGRVIATPPAAAPMALDMHIRRFLNKPNARKQPPDTKSKERLLAASTADPSKISESLLENALEVSSAFSKRFRLDKWMRQWPVGLFKERVADGCQIFSGGKSAIDLVGIRGDTLVLFELKNGDNRKAGAVSELLFYASVMRDAIGDAPIFRFESESAIKNCAVSPRDIVRCSNVCAVLLAPRFHPLISEPLMFAELNAAVAQNYLLDRPIHFEAVQISLPRDQNDDFTFTPIH